MLRKQIGLLFALALIFPMARAVFAQDAPAKAAKAAKESRFEGRVANSNKDASTLTVRNSSSNAQRTIAYDSSTKWVSQYHADKKVNDITSSDVKDGDFVIAKGTISKDGVLHATLISKRLSHSQ